MTEEVDEAVEVLPEAPLPLKFWWFTIPGGAKFTHLDLTGVEVLALQSRLGCEWGDMHPMGRIADRMAFLETFLARSDPDNAAARVGSMTMAELEDAVEPEWGRSDDLPVDYEDGLPKGAKAAN